VPVDSGQRSTFASGELDHRQRPIPPSRFRAFLGGRPGQALLLLGLGLASLLVYESVRQSEHFQMIDMVVYRDEGETVRHGHNLYTMIVPTRPIRPSPR